MKMFALSRLMSLRPPTKTPSLVPRSGKELRQFAVEGDESHTAVTEDHSRRAFVTLRVAMQLRLVPRIINALGP